MTIRSTRRHCLRLFGLAGLAGFLGLPGTGRGALAAGSLPIAQGVHKAVGPVSINGTPAAAGAPVGSGDTIVTGPGAEVVYVVGDSAFLQRENSTVRLEGAAIDVLRVITGKLLSVFGKGKRTLTTTTATIGIRGTGCYIECEAKRVYFCLCYGEAEVVPAADPQQVTRIATRHHDHPIMIHHDTAMPAMVDASVVNHSDAELEMLEALVGRRPPFAGSPPRY